VLISDVLVFVQSPAPWTKEGEKTVKKLGLTMQVSRKEGERGDKSSRWPVKDVRIHTVVV